MNFIDTLKLKLQPSHKLVPIVDITFNPTVKLDTIKEHRETIEGYKCPKCGETNLKLAQLEEGKTGWEAHVTCRRCGSNMTLNSTGFQINFAEKTGTK